MAWLQSIGRQARDPGRVDTAAQVQVQRGKGTSPDQNAPGQREFFVFPGGLQLSGWGPSYCSEP